MSGLQQLAQATAGFSGLSAEHEEFRRSVRPFIERLSPEAEVRRLMATDHGYEPRVWRQMAEQLGIQGLIVPEQYGGSGYSFLELGVVLEEAGRALLCAPLLGTTVLATTALLQAEDESARADYLPGIAAGESIATLAITEQSGSWRLQDVRMAARHRAGSWTLTGTKSFVIDAQAADLLLVAALTDRGLSLFAVDAGADGLLRTPLPTMDETRKQSLLRFDDVPARLVGAEGGARPVLEQVLALATIGLAAEQVGGAQRCLEMSVDYAKIRTQFGRAIGSFQAIKHKCADMLMAVEAARSAAYCALDAATRRGPALPAVASLAKAFVSDAYSFVAGENIHIHGGIGFTWEHSAHLYFKRARSSELLFGDPDRHRALFADAIGV